MSWWNPIDWGKGAGKAVADGVLDAITELGEKIKENPEIIGVPVGVGLLIVSGAALAHETGRLLAPATAESIIEEVT